MADFPSGLSGLSLVYWLVSLASCILVLGFSLYTLRIRNDLRVFRLLPFFTINLGMHFVNFLSELNWYRPPPYNDIARISAMVITSLLIVVITRIVPPKRERHARAVRFFFAISGIFMAAHYLASAAYFYSQSYTGDNLYFSGHRIIPALTVFFLSTAAQIYVALEILTRRSISFYGRENRPCLKLISFLLIASIPLILIIDQIRYFFPVLWTPLQEERLIILPGFNILLNLIFLRMLSRTVATVTRSQSVSVNPLTKREIQVAILLAEGAAYKEISKDLSISLSTVQSHVKNIYRKTGVNGKSPLLLYLQSENIIKSRKPDNT